MKTKNLLIILAFFLALGGIGYLFRWHIDVWYYNIAHNHFEKGDRMYASQNAFKGEVNAIPLYRVIRPCTEHELDSLGMSGYDKLLLVKSLGANAKPYAVTVNKHFLEDNLRQSHSAFIGLYSGHEVLNLKGSKEMFFSNFYRIEPSKKALLDEGSNPELPKGYTWQDDYLYIEAFQAEDKETFKL